MNQTRAPLTRSRVAWALRLASLILLGGELLLFAAMIYGLARYPDGPFARTMLRFVLPAMLLINLIDILTLRWVARRIERWEEERAR